MRHSAEELGATPTIEVVARSLEGVATIDRIAACSENIHGSLQKKLSEAAALIRVAAGTLVERAQKPEGEGELSLLRRELKALSDRNADLDKEALVALKRRRPLRTAAVTIISD